MCIYKLEICASILVTVFGKIHMSPGGLQLLTGIVLVNCRTDSINAALKLAFLFALPIFVGLWLALGIFGSVLVGLGYGFVTPWVSTFEAFRKDGETNKFLHSIVVKRLLKLKFCELFSMLLWATNCLAITWLNIWH